MSKINSVPPHIPLLWRDWESSPDIRSMSMTQRGIYLSILIKCWIFGDVPRDPWQLHKLIGADYKSTVRLLEQYSHLLVCCECGASWTPVDCQCGDSNLTARCHNLKLKYLNKDVNSGLSLGTTEENLMEPNPTDDGAASPPSNLVEQEVGQGEPKPSQPSSGPVMNPSADYFKNPDGSRPLEGFDPFAIEPFDGWTADQIKIVADHHWNKSKNSFWRDKCETEEFFKRNFEKMSKAVPRRSKPKTRTQEKYKQVEV
jgi:hypothetical protein